MKESFQEQQREITQLKAEKRKAQEQLDDCQKKQKKMLFAFDLMKKKLQK